MYLYRFLVYQDNTKIYDGDFQLSVTEDNIEDWIYIFNNLYLWYYLIRSKVFTEWQDQPKWFYLVSDKVFKDPLDPYMIVMHKDLEGKMNLSVWPQYFKNTRNHKITPNLWDLENLELRNTLEDKESYTRKAFHRNCFKLAVEDLNLEL